MATAVALPRPDLAAHREALTLPWQELVKRLADMVGRKLTAYIAGVKDVRALDRWVADIERTRFTSGRSGMVDRRQPGVGR
jgi:hypothetical protein